MKTYVVTGSTGAIGTALVSRLAEEDNRVFAVVRPDSPRKKNIPTGSNIEVIERDITDLRTLSQEISQADVLFHLAWQSPAGPGRNDMYLQTGNIRCALDAVETAHDMGCQAFILAGSQAEYGRSDKPLTPDTPSRPENGYGMAKLCAEEMTGFKCRQYGIRCPHPRILSVYGPNDGGSMIMNTIRNLLAGKKCEFTKGEQIWDFLYSKDAAEILCRIAENGQDGKIYPVGSGEARPLSDYISELRDIVSPDAALDFGALPYGENQVMYLSADMQAVEQDLGYRPETSFSSGVMATVSAVRKELESSI